MQRQKHIALLERCVEISQNARIMGILLLVHF